MITEVLNWVHNYPTLAGACVASFAALVAILTLRANHDWNRRQFAISMVGSWNDETAAHRKAIEKEIPGLIDLDKTSNKVAEITKARAAQIYGCSPQDPDWELRFHLIELGNYFEFVASAYIHNVGDRKIIKQSLSAPLTRWHRIMLHFIEILEERRGYHPWAPFSEVVHRWRHPYTFWLRPPTA